MHYVHHEKALPSFLPSLLCVWSRRTGGVEQRGGGEGGREGARDDGADWHNDGRVVTASFTPPPILSLLRTKGEREICVRLCLLVLRRTACSDVHYYPPSSLFLVRTVY